MNHELAATMGREMRRARTAQGLTQERAAEAIGVSVEFYARVERGKSHPSVETFQHIASTLEVSADVLLGLDGERGALPAAALWQRGEDDPPHLRRIMARVEALPDSTRRLVEMVLKECERIERQRDAAPDD
ncbi:helix-turn-helix domain-containing protein [Haliangium ochraceum]|uniref:Transcriptional regulator, XRE family n=1 Tax=Haliangium ochraceum (strain DSM 14365 / JCM 11303 / SMP-2) TaxID=502025 RepID=D0LM94_HALO1|nr:helix-turn-helix transcriptional regulator [Haliangium ochraceum]ACY16800.1 transcriptional regulator, XRE family [Haliangium ochraceum DSM 14365]